MIFPKLFIPGPTQVDAATLTAMTQPQVEHRTAEFSELMEQHGFRIDRGYGKLWGKVFRIAHMGSVMMDDLKEYLMVWDQVQASLEAPV
ncbi:MAG: hypothetical protein V3W14_02160 [Candidatus Neomarinimicrobiota bacterium]